MYQVELIRTVTIRILIVKAVNKRLKLRYQVRNDFIAKSVYDFVKSLEVYSGFNKQKVKFMPY